MIKKFLNILVILMLILLMLTGCGEEGTETENTENEIEQTVENKTININEYIGDWECTIDNDILRFELLKDEDEIRYYLLYYPDSSLHASEELWGNWEVKENIENINNENTNAIATYDLTNIVYKEDSIEIEIKSREILSSNLEEYKIPDGRYSFKKIDL